MNISCSFYMAILYIKEKMRNNSSRRMYLCEKTESLLISMYTWQKQATAPTALNTEDQNCMTGSFYKQLIITYCENMFRSEHRIRDDIRHVITVSQTGNRRTSGTSAPYLPVKAQDRPAGCTQMAGVEGAASPA